MRHIHKHNLYKNLSHKKQILFYLLSISGLFFIILFFIFLFSLKSIFGYLSIFFLIISTIFLYFLLTIKENTNIKNLLDLHSKKRELILEKEELTKSFFERKIDDKQYEDELNNIDEKILDLDFKIKNFDEKEVNKLTELKERKKIIEEKFFSKKIGSKLYQKINLELERQTALLKAKNKNIKSKK